MSKALFGQAQSTRVFIILMKKTIASKVFFNFKFQLIKKPVINIIEDDLKNLWIVTKSSIIRLNRDRKNYFIYGKKYGIRPHTLLTGICKTKSGDILVGNNNGFYVLTPKEMNEQSKPLELV